jgi:hypothetical protein
MEVGAGVISGRPCQEDWGEWDDHSQLGEGEDEPIKPYFERLEKIVGDLPSC